MWLEFFWAWERMSVALFHSLASAAACDAALPLGPAAVVAAALVLVAVALSFCCGCLVGGGGVWLAVHSRGQVGGFPSKGWERRLSGYRLE